MDDTSEPYGKIKLGINKTLSGEQKYNLGHLDEYRLAFNYISRALIYRFPLNSPMEKIRDAMHLELYASQIRSFSFSAIKKLTSPDYYEYFHCDINRINVKKYLNKHREKVYDHVINACKVHTITITENGKNDRKTYPINMEYESKETALYYAYLYFRNLPTDDYINEIDNLIKKAPQKTRQNNSLYP